MLCVKFTAFCDLRIRLATLRKSVRKFWFCKLALTCVDVRVRLARALYRKSCADVLHSVRFYSAGWRYQSTVASYF